MFLVLSRPAILGTVVLSLLAVCSANSQPAGLTHSFDRGYGQVEVGGRFVGAEFHRSRPLPSRISFYYPVANSIDLMTDYWRRDESRPMAVGLQVDDGPKEWIGREAWDYLLSPHRVVFSRRLEGLAITMAYEFCFTRSAMVFSLTLRNVTGKGARAQVYTHLRPGLRTCQTYARFDSAWTDYDAAGHALILQYDEHATDHAAIIAQNVGAEPSSWTTDAGAIGVTDSGTSRWVPASHDLGRRLFPPGKKGDAVAAFLYDASLQPGDSLCIVQVIGSSRGDEARRLAGQLAGTWRGEVEDYDRFVLGQVGPTDQLQTGDAWVDRSVPWALGVLAVMAHYLDGAIVPMPCPAEYNFFFTHDMLVTDMGAVNFDPARVKKDLLYLVSHAKDNVIPHAYYWRDDGFKTEYCAPENWNHRWFIITAASYLRHSLDDSTARALYPCVARSAADMLGQLKPDGLMHAYWLDCGDIGHQEGPRACTTILAIRAFREFVYFSSMLGKFTPDLRRYESIADTMEHSLESRLWDEASGYLKDYDGPKQDYHYFCGPLIAPAFGLLSHEHTLRLVETASKVLVDPRIGVRSISPMDLHTDSARAFYKFADNEAGNPYLYGNGGVWANDNAWFALALRATGRPDDALRFFRTTMTVDGILNSPMGLPAMYEYRFSDPSSPEYGRIDKPAFLWGGGFFLYTLYHLLGIDENEWNLSVGGSVPSSFSSVHYPVAFGPLKNVEQRRSGSRLENFTADGTHVPSRVIPLELRAKEQWSVTLGKVRAPYLSAINAIVYSVRTLKNSLEIELSSFDGHQVAAKFMAPGRVRIATFSGKKVERISVVRQDDGSVMSELHFPGSGTRQKLVVGF